MRRREGEILSKKFDSRGSVGEKRVISFAAKAVERERIEGILSKGPFGLANPPSRARLHSPHVLQHIFLGAGEHWMGRGAAAKRSAVGGGGGGGTSSAS